MPEAIEVCGVQLPGRGARFREAPIHLLSALVRELTPAFARTVDRPFAFFGHSLGGLIAFELSRALALIGAAQPTHLFVSGVHAPRFRDHERNYHRLDDAGLAQVLRNYGATPPEILDQEDLLALFLPTIRADFAMAESYRYRPGPILSVPITALAGRDDERRSLDQVDGWALETNAEFSTCWFDGGHFFLNPHRAKVIDLVLSRLRNPYVPMPVRHVG